MDPIKLDRPLLSELVDKYGYADIAAELDRRDGWPLEEDFLTGGMPPDDYIRCHITQKQDWIDLYATPYYFGCEADDRMNAVAFGKAMLLGARINAIYSSDIGHFDVVDMRDPLPEAFELVEDGHITESDFHDFAFGDAVRLWGTQNPRFFDPRPVDLLGHRARRAAKAFELLVQLSEPVLTRPNLIPQPWRRPVALRHELDEVRQLALNFPPLPGQGVDLLRRRAVELPQHLVGGHHEVVDPVGAEGGLEFRQELRLEDRLRDRHPIRADRRALRHNQARGQVG